MKKTILTLWSLLGCGAFMLQAADDAPWAAPKLEVPYGNNAAAGESVQVNGIRLYFETYGKGQPLLALHGNGQDISALGHQIKFFSDRYRVIAPDSRGHGRSEMGAGRLTYEQMAEDVNALLEKLNLKQVYVLGWSDGGIVGLLLAIHHPDKVAKLAIMGANLEPAGAHDWAQAWVSQQEKITDAMIASHDTSQPWAVQKQHLDLLGKQPHIPARDLTRITVPTLVMAADKDVIRDEHTLQIFHALPRAQLCIFPGATHMIAWQNPELFNQTAGKFFSEPFRRPDTREFYSGSAGSR
jgi:pimeloyl-ACP methyl ester carboxylesterase